MTVTDTPNSIIEKIDDFIESCKKEIQNRRGNNDKRPNQSDALQKYVACRKGERFGFNACVKDCFGEKFVETYKACSKRIRDPQKKPSPEDFKKMECLYEKMQKIYTADSLFECPKLPSNTTLLSKNLRELMDKASRFFDKQILEKDKR